MQYLAVIHGDEAAWERLSEAARKDVMDAYYAFSDEAGKAGVIVDGNELDSTATATTVRVRKGETLVTDGPFAELKDQIGGYYLFECDSIDAACTWAAKIPAASNGVIEVRPVHIDEEEQS